MPDEKGLLIDPPGQPELWSFEGNRRRQLRLGLTLTPVERLRWLEETVEELLPWVGRARVGRPHDLDK